MAIIDHEIPYLATKVMIYVEIIFLWNSAGIGFKIELNTHGTRHL